MPISLSITSSMPAMSNSGQTAEITFRFSEQPLDFTVGDVLVANGTLSAFASTVDPLIYKATFSPTMTGAGQVSVAAGAYTDAASNPNQAGASVSIAIDQTPPTVAVTSSLAELIAGEVATISFTFSEAPVGFSLSDVSAAGGAMSDLQATSNPLVYTAKFTPTAGVAMGSASITVASSYTDAAGNAGASAALPSLTIRTALAPTIVVADTVLGIGEDSLVTFSFGQAVSGFTNDDLTVVNGTLSTLVDQGGGNVWTARFTPTSDLTDTSNQITLNLGGLTGLPARTISSNSFTVDTVRPTASVTVANTQLQAGQTSSVTFTFSEAVSGFTVPDVAVANGALSNLASADGGVTWTATLTPSVGVVDASNLIVLDTAGVVDQAGNVGASAAISNNYQVGYVPPPPVSEDDVVSLPAGGGQVAAGPGADSVAGAGGADLIQGNTGNDTLIGGGGDDIVRGGQDNDFVHGNAGADLLFGDLGNDSVFGGQGEDFVQGGAGSDYVVGDLGRDTVLGGQGADTVVGGAGDDVLSGDLGDDVLLGGVGADLFNFAAGGGRDVVMDFSSAEGDRIRIAPSDAADFAALSSKLVADPAGTLIQLGGQSILLAGVAPGALSAADFVFG
ncbi:MAG: hypothetical protein KBC34_04950 [Phenylobacterium sp.]|nr:hypothetical protein [Phenylobacterium sp.]